MEHSLIANSGIQIITFPLSINTQEKFKMWYHEWYDTENGEWRLDPVYELRTDDECYYYNKQKLHKGGYLSDPTIEIDVNDLKNDGILPLRIEDENCEGVKGDIFNMTFSDKDNKLASFENVWLPIPYFFKRTPKRFKFGPLNWSRVKLIPKGEERGKKNYDVLLAFDTRARYENDEYDECPVFPDVFRGDMDFELCSNEFYLMDYCSPGNNWSYIDEYLLHLVHPGIQRVSQIKGANVRRMAYIASYTFLINYLAKQGSFPKIKLYKDTDVEIKDVDMVVDIGNSRTTALLIEDNTNFNQVRQLELTDYTNLIKEVGDSIAINKHDEPFDMRLAFRKVDFGDFGIKDSKQFVYPSLIRLGQEANTLIHLATNSADEVESLSTYSSPKRYLWDWRPNKEEWKFLVLNGEKDDHILNVRGITNQLKSDGKLDLTGESGSSFHYSRRSLMTFSFLEMLIQAKTQINGENHRSNKTGFGKPSMPRKVRRIIVTCPTAMSKVEREALIHCAKDAVILLENFEYKNPVDNPKPGKSVEVIPAVRSMKDDDGSWYYDEATCSQLVYMYGEVGHKYKGCCQEFFNLYGKIEEGDEQQKQGGKRREGQDQPVPEALVEAHDHGGEAYHEPELQEELLDLVPGEGLGLGAIEAVLLLDVHGVVPGEGDEGQGRQSAEEHHREQLTPVVPGEQPGEGGVGVGQDQYEVDDEAGRGGEHAEADLFPMIGLPLQIGVPVVHVRHVLRDGVLGGASAEDVQCQPVQVYRAQDGDGDDLIVHSVSSRFVL